MQKFLSLIILISLLHLSGYAQDDLPEKPESWVNDYATVLSNSEKQNLEGMLSSLQQRSSNQIFIAIFKTMPENQYLDDFSVKLYDKWKPGLAEQDNGILMVIFIDDRKIRIEVGYGLEDVVTDAQAGAVIRNHIAPQFQTGNYYGGIKAALDVLIPAAEGKYQIPIEQQKRKKGKDSPIAAVLIVFFIFTVLSRIFGRRSTGYGSRGRHTGFGGPFIFGGGRGGSGGGFSGGGFSGGFGGMSGGGGASGSW